MMIARLTLTIRYTLFLAGVILVMLVGANLITANVVRNGLRDLFQQRLDYAGEALGHYAKWHLWSRWNEIETLLSSPRFLAAVQTSDSSTIDQEAPGYLNLIGADLFVIANAENSIVFSNAAQDALQKIRAVMEMRLAGDTVVILDNNGQPFETFLTPIKTADGFGLGLLAAGFPFDRTILSDIKHLTGFDAIVTNENHVIGYTESDLTRKIMATDDWRPDRNSDGPGDSLVSAEKVVHRTLAMPVLGCGVTLVASMDEHITPILRSQLQRMFLLAIVAGLLAIGIIYLFIRRRIGGQVGLLVEATKKIARDEMDFDINTNSRDEFGYLANQLDIMRSRLLQNRRELESAHEERIKSTRLATVGQLAAGIIHDFKNPIAVIRGTAELMTMTESKNGRSFKGCQTIIDQVDRMTDLTRDILEYARGKSNLNPEEIDLGAYLDEITKTYESEFFKRSINLLAAYGPPARLRIDRIRFRRVLENLIGNAMEALHPGGTINLSWVVDNDTLDLKISDDGPGIPDEIIDTLFEPFVTSGKRQGTGLGLAIAKKIVEEHGGNIAVISESGGGACFIVSLAFQDGHKPQNENVEPELKGARR